MKLGRQRVAGSCGFEIQATSYEKVQHQLFLPLAPSPLAPFSVLRRQSCSQPQKPFHLRRCGRKRCGRGRGCTCQSGRRVLCVRLGHGGLGNTGLRCPEEVRENVPKPALGDSAPTSETPWTQDPGPRARPTPPHRQTGRPRRSCSCGASSPLLPACSAPAEVPGQGGGRCEDGGTGCPDKTEGTLQREMQNNQENMPEVTSRAQGTKKESGRNRANSEKPGREPIP